MSVLALEPISFCMISNVNQQTFLFHVRQRKIRIPLHSGYLYYFTHQPLWEFPPLTSFWFHYFFMPNPQTGAIPQANHTSVSHSLMGLLSKGQTRDYAGNIDFLGYENVFVILPNYCCIVLLFKNKTKNSFQPTNCFTPQSLLLH